MIGARGVGRRRAAVVVAWVAAAAALAACSPDGEEQPAVPIPAPPSSTSARPSSTLPVIPTMPSTAFEPTVDAAEEAFRYFLAAYAYAFEAADAGPLLNVCGTESKFCKSAIDLADKLQREERRFKGGGFSKVLVQGAATGDPGKGQVLIRAVVDQSGSILRSRLDGRALKTIKGERGIGMNVWMDWDGLRWRVGRVVLDPMTSK